MEHILSWMIFFPLIGAVVVCCLPSQRHDLIRAIATVLSLDPASTTTRSSAQTTLSRQARRRSSSFRVMTATETLGITPLTGEDPGPPPGQPRRICHPSVR